MTVVANAGPLIALARIGKLDLLPALYGYLLIPPAVQQETTREPELAGSAELSSANWLHVTRVKNNAEVQRLQFWLDPGESEAIVLAQEQNATLLMDERRGRAIAATLGLNVTGTVGILLAAKTQGHVPVVIPLLDALITAGVRISPRLYEQATQLAGEK
ncbi:MAG: DUF3368 domain-containing protein [Anaerolineae bacterium]